MEPRTADFDYALPGSLIAQQPCRPRDASGLMVLSRADGRCVHRHFRDLPSLLREGDLLVVNDTRVVPARFHCRRPTGARLEGLFLRELAPGQWEVMLKGADRCKVGERLAFEADAVEAMTLLAPLGQGVWRVSVAATPADKLLERVGLTPLPPYILRQRKTAPQTPEECDRQAYQTVYAAQSGAVAAPTAGLHFTPQVLDELNRHGIELATVTLHVGLGTFAPVKAERLGEHRMHAEWYCLSAQAAEAVSRAKRDGRRVVAVGTTSVRVLETAARTPGSTGVSPASRGMGILSMRPTGVSPVPHRTGETPVLPGATEGWTDIFIYPPADFAVVDALITNFHLPRSTLLMLVSAFCDPGGTGGIQRILAAYAEAIRHGYRFYSYGDAMLIE